MSGTAPRTERRPDFLRPRHFGSLKLPTAKGLEPTRLGAMVSRCSKPGLLGGSEGKVVAARVTDKADLRVRLLPLEESDFSGILEAISSREDLVQWSGPSCFTFPLDHSQLAAYLEKSCRPGSTCRAFRAVDGIGRCFGMIEIGLMDRDNQSASLCRILIHPHERKRGLCLPMIREALRLSFEDLGMRRIDLRVYSFNSAAVRCYERAGLVVEGILRKGQMVGDCVWDTVLMGILREEWEEGRQPSPRSGSESP